MINFNFFFFLKVAVSCLNNSRGDVVKRTSFIGLYINSISTFYLCK